MITGNQAYSDVPFFLTPNRFTQDFNLVKDASAIRQSIKNIVMCNQGERPFDFDFGVSVFKSLFDNLTPEVTLDLQRRIVTNLKQYDNRIEVLDIRVKDAREFDKNELNTLLITITYEIPDIGINDVVTISIARNR